jgi:hypothetical protein
LIGEATNMNELTARATCRDCTFTLSIWFTRAMSLLVMLNVETWSR